MILIDAQLSPNLAIWIKEEFQIETFSCKFLNLTTSSDLEIFQKARNLKYIVLTKDEDFVKLLDRYGSPPKIIWIT
jgi:predicted nuclease of predicted toxin-antitoxin system